MREATADAEVESAALDALFGNLWVPEGYRVEIAEETIRRWPQDATRWECVRRLLRACTRRLGPEAPVLSGVRVDLPGRLHAYTPDLVRFREGAAPVARGGMERWRYQDVEWLVEVVSPNGFDAFGVKLRTYARAGVPLYLVVDPGRARCHAYTRPRRDAYAQELAVAYGTPLDLRETSLGLLLDTSVLPRTPVPRDAANANS